MTKLASRELRYRSRSRVYTRLVERRKEIRYPSLYGRGGYSRAPVTLPGIIGVNEGPIVDVMTQQYIGKVILENGKYIRIIESTPTVS